jgi:hypothetical protein
MVLWLTLRPSALNVANDPVVAPSRYRAWLLRAFTIRVPFDWQFLLAITLFRLAIQIEMEATKLHLPEFFWQAVAVPVSLWLLGRLLKVTGFRARRPTAMQTLVTLTFAAFVVAADSILIWQFLDGAPEFSLVGLFLGCWFAVVLIYSMLTQTRAITARYSAMRLREATIRASVLQLQDEAASLIESVAAETKLTTYEAFLVHFAELQHLIQQRVPEKAEQLVAAMREGSVRPLARNLLSDIVDWEALLKPRVVSNPFRLPSEFAIGQALRPELFVVLSPVFVIAKIAIEGPGRFWSATVYIILQALLWFLVAKVYRNVVAPTWLGVTAILVFAFGIPAVATVPQILFEFDFDDAFSVEYLQNLQLSPVLVLVIAYFLSISTSLGHSGKLLEELGTQVTLQKALIGQSIRSMRRQYGYFLHGTIQSALNAANMRLQQSNFTDAGWRRFLVDIDEAEKMLLQWRLQPVDLNQHMAEIQELWQDVAEVTVEWQENAMEVVQADSSVAFSVNEIWREAVSNAIRHGGANRILIRHSLAGDALLLEIGNNGSVPSSSLQANLGLSLLDDLTFEWWFESDSGKTMPVCLHAKLLLGAGTPEMPLPSNHGQAR